MSVNGVVPGPREGGRADADEPAEQDHAIFHAGRQAPSHVNSEGIHLRRPPRPRLGHRQPRRPQVLRDRVP